MASLDDLQDQQPSNSTLRPETTDYLNSLAGIGTQAYMAMRDPDLPEYEDWRDFNFAPDDSGNYLSREGQSYTDDQLEHMHGFLSRQAGNPFVSGLFDGPDSPIADYMVWRNQNFSNDNGPWEDEDGNLYSEQALQGMFADKFGAEPEDSSEESGQNAQPAPAGQSATQASPGQQQPPPLGNRMSDLAESLKQTADYLKWRDQNYRQTDDGRWEGADARIHTNEELRGLYDAQQERERQAREQRRYLTPDEQDEAGKVAYSETTRGSVAEHEAIISVILNRAQSGQRQYVNHGQDVNVHNVINATTRRGVLQFQGVGGDNYNEFDTANNPGVQNARTAAESIARNGPTNQATAFIVTGGRNPTRAEVSGLGQHMRRTGRVGNVFLYRERPNPPAQHHHPPRLQPQPPQQQNQHQPDDVEE